MNRIYLDYNASTPIAPEVVDVMRRFLSEDFGNPSGQHWAGVPARLAVETARAQVAELLGCSAHEIVFTSGGSEANNHALAGAFFAPHSNRRHIVTTAVEHPAIIEPCRFLERFGATVTYVPVDGTGLVDPDDVRKAITTDTMLVTVMHANNEVGTIQPIPEIARIAREHGALFHTDAAQAAGKIPTRVDDLGVDLLSIAGHKVYAPKGVGALYIRDGVTLEPFIHGAGHESGRRAGTESALLASALGTACAISAAWISTAGIKALRDMFWQSLQDAFGKAVVLNGHGERRLPNTLNVSFLGHIGADILADLDTVAASTGSACHAGTVDPSPVLSAMDVTTEVAAGAVR
ncbi:MAG: cysteine desulfurase family protein, partial [Alphaproteobacteria bacterium]